jgi:S1-C subfamily serine protease
VNLLDLGIVVWAIVAAIGGYRRGATLQLMEYAGLIVGLGVGAIIAPAVATLVSPSIARSTVALIVLLVVAAGGEGIGWLLGRRLWAVTRRSVLRPIDSAGGSVVSVVAVLLVAWFIGFSLSNGPSPTLARQIRSSVIIRTLNDEFPRPPAVLAQVRGLLDRFGFPQVFADLPPAPAGPVQDPTSTEVRRIAQGAETSVVRIVGQACGAIQSGSGFVAAEHYVVTNAHVVAGEDRPVVQFPGGRGSQEGTPVLFDPKLDVAILYVASTPSPILPLADEEFDRGTQGAIVGYPGGGAEQYGPGAVRRELPAVGRDIYGRSIVSRTIYELQAEVIPGDSGGPFVVADGKVGGVVFAASTADPRIGYALTSTDVLDRLDQAVGHTDAVSTQGCAR